MNAETKNHSVKTSAVVLGLIRFAWLLGPEIFAIRGLHDSPLACVLMCVGILAVWLSADIGPFKAADDSGTAEATQKVLKAPKLSARNAMMQAGAKLLVFALLLQTRLMSF